MSMHPYLPKHLTASGFVLHPDRRILLVHHRKLGVWLYPGGHVELHETPDQAVVREVLEETGIRTRILGWRDVALGDAVTDVHVLHTPYRVLCEYINDPADPHYHLDLIYLCAALDEDCIINAEVHAADFFDEHGALELHLFPSFRTLLHRVFQDEAAWALLNQMEVTA
ncbi:NUDIX domain-containing protein [Chitinivorax sp. B]|uniref:NUDIX hydrolase n=1 Tax=Chitinivorax sp. B TaxID=2502235 RepID=UPI0024B5ED8A|nr:NUDIX domain-containing protein [Chitinivorax sp. B]